MSRKTVLVIDTGSSSMRGILYGLSGEELFKKQISYTMQIGSDGSAVMEAQVFADCLCEIASRAAERAKNESWEIAAVALDSQRSSVLPVSETVEPLAPILMWYDKRCACLCDELAEGSCRAVYDRTGMRLTPVASAPKMSWLRRERPDLYGRAYKLIGIHDYLLYLLTGRLCTDASCASRTALMDIRTLQWSSEMLEMFGIDADKLPEILPPGSVVGTVCGAFSEATGLTAAPVVTSGGDQQCCVMGQGLTESGVISVNSGSASYITALTDVPVSDPEMETNATLFCYGNKYVAEASNMGSGTVIEWFLRSFYGPNGFDVLDREIETEPAGSRGMICIPEFAGSGCPHSDPYAHGMFAGIDLSCTRATFARSLIEGLCFDINDAMRHLFRNGAAGDRICSTGGISRFPSYNQMLADITGLPVEVNHEPEATALGALAVALTALGYCEGPERFLGSRTEGRTLYLPSEKDREVYAKLAERRRLYRKAEFEAAAAAAGKR